MKTEDVRTIIDDNDVIQNIGGHNFVGTTKHDGKKGKLQLKDLLPFEELGIIRRVLGFPAIGKPYISAFVKVKKV